MNYFSRITIVGSMLLALPLTFYSCKDFNEDELTQLRLNQTKDVTALQNQLNELVTELNKLKDRRPDELEKDENGDYFDEDGTPIKGSAGKTPIAQDGYWWVEDENGVLQKTATATNIPYIKNGNWWINGVDTGNKAQGENGTNGSNGSNGTNGSDGLTPYIGDNGNWWIGTTDTGVKATGNNGTNGITPHIGDNGNWWIGNTDTGVKAAGTDGINGSNGLTPYIGNNGNWWIGETDTNVPAKGEKGDAATISIDDNGYWVINGVTTDVKAEGVQGLSAYEIAVKHGFTGTEEEWLASLKGADGQDSPDRPYITSIAIAEDGTGNIVFYYNNGDSFVLDITGYACNQEDCLYAYSVAQEVVKAFFVNEEIDITKLSDKITEALNKIDKALDYIDALKERATSISVDGVNNSVFGMVKTALGVQTNMLMGFYGNISQRVDFPSITATYYADKSTILDDTYVSINRERINPGPKYTEKLGTAYFSINPAQVDFTGVDMSLTNTQGNNNGVVLSRVKASNAVLQMGYTPTRANANGFYEAVATVEDFDAVEKIDFNVDDYQNLASAIKNGNNRVSALAEALLGTAQAFKTNAYALKLEKSDSLPNKYGLPHTVMSPYAIQAALIKPVGYDLTSKLPTKLPGYNKLTSYTNKVIKKLVDRLQNNKDLVNFQKTLENLGEIEEISFEIKPGTGDLINKDVLIDLNFTFEDTIEITVPIKAGSDITIDKDVEVDVTLIDNDGKELTGKGTGKFHYSDSVKIDTTVTVIQPISVTYDGVKTVNITITQEDLKEFYDSLNEQINGSMASINDMLESVNSAVSQGLNLINKLRDPELAGNIQNTVNGLIERVWNKLDQIYSAVETRFEMAMFTSSNGKLGLAGRSVNNPSVVSGGNFTAVLTNLNAEMIVPAFKKHLCVTNAWGAANKRAACDAVNASINKVIDGTQQKVYVSGLKKGVTYEFSYSALDYAGKQMTRKYYVKCK